MKCPKCGHENPPENLYCEECDWRLDQTYKGKDPTEPKKRNSLAFAVVSLIVGVIAIALAFVDGADIGAVIVGAIGMLVGSYSVNLPRYLQDKNKGVCMGLSGIGMILSVFGFIVGLAIIAGVF